MYSPETVHRYPRILTLAIEGISFLIVALSAFNLAITLLRFAWDTIGLDRTLFERIPFLSVVVAWINGPLDRPLIDTFSSLLAPLGWMALALLVVLLLRNAFPMVRSSSRGLLVEFAGDWLPIPWDRLEAIKVTSDVAGERFVLLAQASAPALTGWHRGYSLIYRLSGRRGFWVTSNISEFDALVRTILEETERSARVGGQAKPLRLEEQAASPLFRFLLGPASFFSQRGPAEVAADAAVDPASAVLSGGPMRGNYPLRITALLNWGIIIFVVLVLWQYLFFWVRFLALEIPALRSIPPFSWPFSEAAYSELASAFRTTGVPFFGVAGRADLPAPWWLLVAAHLLLLVALGVVLLLRGLLPALEARPEGLALRPLFSQRWWLLPWNQVIAIKATEFSEQSQVLLIQARGSKLPNSSRFASLIYDGSFAPGILVTSALSNFQPLIQRVLLEVTSAQAQRQQQPDEPPLLQQESPSWMLLLAFKAGVALDQLVALFRDDAVSRTVQTPALLRAAGPMLWLALPPVLLLLIEKVLLGGTPPSLGITFQALLLWLIGMLEWPLVCLLAMVLDDTTGGGEEGYRAFYIYPRSQLPRLFALLAALLLVLAGVPLLPLLVWLGAIVWSFLLAAGLWEALYGWKGSQALLGGLIPVVWQMLVLLVYLLVQR